MIYYINYDNHDYDHVGRIDIIKKQAEAMGIQVEIYEGGRKKVKDLHKFAKILERYSKANVKYLVTGSIFDRLAYKINTELTEYTEIQLKCPLWGLTHEEILTNIEKRNIKAIITNIDPNLLNTDWLRKIYDRNVYNKLVKLNINPFGDDGEFDE